MTRRRHVELPPRRIEQPTHAHTDDCKLTTIEDGQVVVYRGRKAVVDWLNRVADLARERSGQTAAIGAAAVSPVRAHQPHRFLPRPETPPASDAMRDDPAVVSE